MTAEEGIYPNVREAKFGAGGRVGVTTGGKPFKRPTLIWVGAKPYEVVYDHDALALIGQQRGQRLLGFTTSHDLIITLDHTVKEPIIRDTLAHEILHGLWLDAGLNEFHDATEEQIVNALAPRLVLLLRSNPDFVDYLTFSLEAEAEE